MKQKEKPSRTTLRVKKHNALWRSLRCFVKALSKLCEGQVVPLFWENVAQHLTKCCPTLGRKLGNIWASRAYVWAYMWVCMWACVPACVGVHASSLAKTFHKIKSSFRYLKVWQRTLIRIWERQFANIPLGIKTNSYTFSKVCVGGL